MKKNSIYNVTVNGSDNEVYLVYDPHPVALE